MGYHVRLDVFEGPFDLLVYLIEHAQMSIYDIRISEITSQYIGYVEKMKREDVALSSEFMALAAALIEIKSKMLLPRSVSENGKNEIMEDPRTELVEKLVEYKKFKSISEMLDRRWEDTSLYLEKPQEDLSVYTGEPDEYLDLDIDRFRIAFERFLSRKRKIEEIREHHKRTEKQRITTEMKIDRIKDYFRSSQLTEADFKELLIKKDDRYDIAVTFSSVLEMMKQNRLDAWQKHIYGDITVKATDYIFDAVTEDENKEEEGNVQ